MKNTLNGFAHEVKITLRFAITNKFKVLARVIILAAYLVAMPVADATGNPATIYWTIIIAPLVAFCAFVATGLLFARHTIYFSVVSPLLFILAMTMLFTVSDTKMALWDSSFTEIHEHFRIGAMYIYLSIKYFLPLALIAICLASVRKAPAFFEKHRWYTLIIGLIYTGFIAVNLATNALQPIAHIGGLALYILAATLGIFYSKKITLRTDVARLAVLLPLAFQSIAALIIDLLTPDNSQISASLIFYAVPTAIIIHFLLKLFKTRRESYEQYR